METPKSVMPLAKDKKRKKTEENNLEGRCLCKGLNLKAATRTEGFEDVA